MTSKKMRNVPWYERPEPKPPDIRDKEEHAAVSAALADLPGDHPARRAYSDGMGTIALTHVVGREHHPAVVAALTEAYLAGNRRSLQRGGSFRP